MGAWLQYFFSFHGRITRSQFWLFYLFWLGFEIGGVVAFGLVYAVWIWSHNGAVTTTVEIIIFLPLWVAAISLTVGWFAIWTKRLHDRNRSGWWSVWPYVMIGAIAVFDHFRTTASDAVLYPAVVLLTAIAAMLIRLVLEVGFFRGTLGDNRFGPDPLAAKA